MKRFVSGTVRWDPGRKERAPLCWVHCSRAIQKPSADRGLVYWTIQVRDAVSSLDRLHTRNVLVHGLSNRIGKKFQEEPTSRYAPWLLFNSKFNLPWPLYLNNTPSPPICVCLVITMDCRAWEEGRRQCSAGVAGDYAPTGSRWNLKSRTNALRVSFSSVTFRKAGSNSWSALKCSRHGYGRQGAILYLPCPILFTDFCFSLINFPCLSTASSSRK